MPLLELPALCRGGLLNYTCTKKFGCAFSYSLRLGRKKLNNSIMSKAYRCLTDCQRASEHEESPSCFDSCCPCLEAIYRTLAMVQPPRYMDSHSKSKEKS